MRDRVEIAIVVRTDELSGKSVKAIAPVLKSAVKKIEPQLMRIVEVITKAVEHEYQPKQD